MKTGGAGGGRMKTLHRQDPANIIDMIFWAEFISLLYNSINNFLKFNFEKSKSFAFHYILFRFFGFLEVTIFHGMIHAKENI